MKIVGYNIQYGGKGRELSIAECLKITNPDLVILAEAIYPEVVKTLAQQLGFAYYDSLPSKSIGFLSKIPPQSYQWHDCPKLRSPFLEIQFNNDLSIFGIHLSSLLTGWREVQRVHQIHQLLQVIASSPTSSHLLIGDFNTIAPHDGVDLDQMPRWLQLLIRFSGGIHHEALETLISANYIDVFRHLHPNDAGYTLPPPIPNSRLDYAFVSASLIDSVGDCRVIREPESVDLASDHYPLFIEIEI